MAKITYDEYLALIREPDTPEQTILEYSLVRRGESAFAPEIVANPDKVEMAPAERELENAMAIGNSMARWRRGLAFLRRRERNDPRPVLVAEGDSWFQFPIVINETVDALTQHYSIWCVSAAGDTAYNMVYGGREFANELRRYRDEVQGFLFSAAGNDIIGEDPVTKRSALLDIVKPFNGNPRDAVGHIDMAVLGDRLNFLHKAYDEVIRTAREVVPRPAGQELPVFIHGYDYCFPYPWGSDDKRAPLWAKKDAWLGNVFRARQIGPENAELQRNIIKFLIDALHDMLTGFSEDPAQTRVWLVDCRGAMPEVTDWADEIHGTSKGFAKVASRFRTALQQAGVR